MKASGWDWKQVMMVAGHLGLEIPVYLLERQQK
jgi:hypothetical protein